MYKVMFGLEFKIDNLNRVDLYLRKINVKHEGNLTVFIKFFNNSTAHLPGQEVNCKCITIQLSRFSGTLTHISLSTQ